MDLRLLMPCILPNCSFNDCAVALLVSSYSPSRLDGMWRVAGPRVDKGAWSEALSFGNIEAVWAVHLISVHLGLLNLVVALPLSPFIGNYLILFPSIRNPPMP